jgi:hypothetical protein
MYRRIKKRKGERDRPEQSLFDGTIVRCFIAATILASSVVEATPVPVMFQSEPNLQKSSNTERIASDTFAMNSNGNADGYDEKTDGEWLSDQNVDPWNAAINSEASSTGDASSLEPPPLEDTQVDGTTATEGLSSREPPPLDSQREEYNASDEEEETQTASSSGAGEDTTRSTKASAEAGNSTLWQQHTPEFVDLIVFGGVILVLCCVLTLCLRSIARRTKKKKREKDTLTMFSYMNELNVEDMDIRRSPAGGYHVTYMQGLAVGENSMEDYDDDDDDDEEYTFRGTDDLLITK